LFLCRCIAGHGVRHLAVGAAISTGRSSIAEERTVCCCQVAAEPCVAVKLLLSAVGTREDGRSTASPPYAWKLQ